jgi:Cft2 family RNA processing exonuclease
LAGSLRGTCRPVPPDRCRYAPWSGRALDVSRLPPTLWGRRIERGWAHDPGVAAVRREAVIDLLLTDAAETLTRNRAERPRWLPPGFPMKLTLTMKREALVNHLCDDPQLRKHLRVSSRRLLEPELQSGIDAASFDDKVRRSENPYQLVATALVHQDADVAAAAAKWALRPDQIPVPPNLRLPTTSQKRRPTQPSADQSNAPSEDTSRGESDTLDAGPNDEPHHEQENAKSRSGSSSVARAVPATSNFSSEREQLLRRIRQLEAENLDLRAKVPTKSERRRHNKQQGQVRRAEAELYELNEELHALRTERDHLIGLRHDLEMQLEEAEDARVVALRKSQRLERRLANTAGRAEYLRRALDNDIGAAEAELDELPTGQERTRARRKLDHLRALRDALDRCYPEESAPAAARPRRTVALASLDLTVTPLGGGEEIGGSAILVEAGRRRVLVDAGLHPDGRGPRDIQEVLDGGRLDAIVVTHAHNDHAGYIPRLVDRFHKVPVFCSDATAHLLPTMWADSAKVMDRQYTEADDGLRALPPLYGPAEVERAEERIQDQPFHRAFAVGDLRLTLFPAGHILGAAGVVIATGDQRVVVTGDISGLDDRYLSVESAHLPHGLVADADLLVIETTYCQDSHGQRHRQEQGLVGAVQSVVDRRGRVLIPAFGLGRSQEVVMILRKYLPDVDVLVDGLAKDVTAIYERVAEDRGEELTIIGGRVNPVRNRSREMQSFHSGVIVSTSGMLTGGPSVSWAKSILPDERAALLLCGYQDEEAPGRRLERLASGRPGPRTLTLPDFELGTVDVEVRADVRKYALSAHADQPALLDIIERVRPRETMLVHGLPDKQGAFRRDLRDRGVTTVPTARWQSCR